MKTSLIKTLQKNILRGALGALLALGSMQAQTAVPPLPAGVDQVVKLAQGKMTDDVILTYIRNTKLSCNLTADQIIYLSGQGVSQAAISALMQGAVAAAPVTAPAPISPVAAPLAPAVPAATIPVATTVVAADATIDMFRTQLTSYGTWIQVDGYGLCWRPAEIAAFPAWRPYCDRGHWMYTENGWYWQSDYPWGEIVFHYGRWLRDVRFGWVWVPDSVWGPSWVSWRHADSYCGWAPLPPAARFQAGIGWSFNGRVGVDLDFGLGEDHFIFVGYDRFWETDFHLYLMPRERVHVIFGTSIIYNHYRVEKGRFIFEGIGPDRVGKFTHHSVKPQAVPRGAFFRPDHDDKRGDRNRDKGRESRPISPGGNPPRGGMPH